MKEDKLKLATARYFDSETIVESGLAPVATTVGLPKFGLKFQIAGTAVPIAPHGVFGKKLTEKEFTAGYFERLDSFGVEKIRTLLEAIAGTCDADGAVLLCFCKLDEGYCHRRLFAEWWETKTGEKVPELTGQLNLIGVESAPFRTEPETDPFDAA